MAAISATQIPEKSILDAFNRQTYLGNSFVTGLNGSTIAGTTETVLILLSNPAANLKSLFLHTKKLTCITASNTAIFNFYSAPTITSNGSAATITNLRTGSSLTSSMHAYTSPTISVNGTFLGALSSTAFATSASSTLNIVDPGSSLLVTVTVSGASTKISSELVWYEI